VQVHDVPLLINGDYQTVTVGVGSGVGVYYGPQPGTGDGLRAANSTTFVAAGGSFTISRPVYVVAETKNSTADLSLGAAAPSSGSGGGGGGTTVVPIVAGNLGSTYTLDMQAKDEVRLFGTLNASPLAITTTGWKSGVSRAELVLLKTAGVARTLTIDGASIPVPTAAASVVVVLDTSDGGATIVASVPGSTARRACPARRDRSGPGRRGPLLGQRAEHRQHQPVRCRRPAQPRPDRGPARLHP
jgi:hypothetical protein